VSLPHPTAVSRRAALVAAVGALTVGTACTSDAADPEDGERSRDRATEPLPDVTLAATVVADEQALLDRIDATLARYPRLERVLADARAAHAAHVTLLEDAAPESATPSPAPTAPGRVRVPGDAAGAVRAIARREDELALVDKRSAFAAESGAFARVLASMAASASQQAVVLRAAVVPPGGAR
jgi:hypothetical protein